MLKLALLLAIVVVAVLLVRNLLKRAGSDRSRADAPPAERDAQEPEAKLVRCVDCGAFVPKSGALVAGNGYRCGGPGCKPGG
jgi:hypothetical protein